MERAKEAVTGMGESLGNVSSKAGEALGLKQPTAGERIERGTMEAGGGVKQGGETLAEKIKERMALNPETQEANLSGQVPTSSQP